MVSDLAIWQKIVDMTAYVIPVCNKFPKNQRFVLGQQIQNNKRFKRMRAKRKASVGDIIPTLMSWQGMAKWGNCRTIEKRIFKLLNK